MYLSLLHIAPQTVRGRTWLTNPYRVHQRLLMAFADGEAGRLLFRIEADREPPRILVQSSGPADWERAFADHPVLACAPRQKELHLSLHAGQSLRFLLRANPTAKRGVPCEPAMADNRLAGHRVGLLKEDEQRKWLERKGEVGGFRPLAFEVRPAGQVAFPRGDGNGTQTHASADFEGLLVVVDAANFATTLAAGIGAAKAFGFGLLSVAPA